MGEGERVKISCRIALVEWNSLSLEYNFYTNYLLFFPTDFALTKTKKTKRKYI